MIEPYCLSLEISKDHWTQPDRKVETWSTVLECLVFWWRHGAETELQTGFWELL